MEEIPSFEPQNENEWTKTEYIYDITTETPQVLVEKSGGVVTSCDYGMERISAQTGGTHQQYIYNSLYNMNNYFSSSNKLQDSNNVMTP